MKNIWKNHKIKIIVLIYVIIAGFLIYLAATFMTKKISDISNEIQSRALDREIEQSRVSTIPKMEDDHAYSQENIKALEVMLSNEEGVDFIKKMENIAQETGNSISFKVEEKEQKKDTKASSKKENVEKTIKDSLSYDNYIPIQLDLKGNYNGLVSFLNKLENTRNYVNIISLDLRVEKETVDNSSENRNNQYAGIFSQTQSGNSGNPTEKKERNILHSVINVVLYTKK